MSKMSKDKRDKMVLCGLLFLGIAGALYTFVLVAQKDRLAALNNQVMSSKDKLSKAERLVRSSSMIEANLQQKRKALDQLQENMAPEGQYYYWFLKLVEQFRTTEKLDSSFVM